MQSTFASFDLYLRACTSGKFLALLVPVPGTSTYNTVSIRLSLFRLRRRRGGRRHRQLAPSSPAKYFWGECLNPEPIFEGRLRKYLYRWNRTKKVLFFFSTCIGRREFQRNFNVSTICNDNHEQRTQTQQLPPVFLCSVLISSFDTTYSIAGARLLCFV